MVEKVLILSRVADALRDQLKSWGVEVVDVVTDENRIQFGELRNRYNIIVVSKHFCGNGSHTARLVRQIRREFYDPMIGFERHGGDGQLISLMVAGCNFTLNVGDFDEVGRSIRLCELIDRIVFELKKPHQR